MSAKMCNASYVEGRTAFENGASLLSIVERINAAEGPYEETRALSFAVGFADGLIALLRKPIAIVSATLPPENIVDGNIVIKGSETR